MSHERIARQSESSAAAVTEATRRRVRRDATVAVLLACACQAHAQQDGDSFHDPFLQLTQGLPGCPVASPSTYTEQELRDIAHDRAQRGVSCWLDGRCRLPSAYQYDAEIIPRVARAVEHAGNLADTSLWALGQRRHVWLMGCVSRQEQIRQLETLVRRIDDVEDVHLQLIVGTQGQVSYKVAR